MSSFIHELIKKKDSELRFVKKEIHTISKEQNSHWDSITKSGQRRILFDKSCLRHILFIKKSGLQRIFVIENLLLNHSGMRLISSFLFCLPIYWWCKLFEIQY
jgi:hypothetical protein